MIATIVPAARAVRPGREAGRSASVRMFLTGRRTPDLATDAAPTGLATVTVAGPMGGPMGGECRSTVWVGSTLDSAPGICAAPSEEFGSMREFAARGCSPLPARD